MKRHLATFLALAAAAAAVGRSDGHPQCLDFGPPFRPVEPRPFCARYSNLTCCTRAEDDALRERHRKLTARISGCESGYVRDVLCERCSPFAAHVYDAEHGPARSFPGLCPDYCEQALRKCPQGIASLTVVTPDFCRRIALPDPDYCFPDALERPARRRELASSADDGRCACVRRWTRDEFANPLQMVALPGRDDYVLVVEQRGVIYSYLGNGTRVGVALDLRHATLTSARNGDERGMLSIALHPDFERNRLLYVYYVTRNESEEITRLSQFAMTEDDFLVVNVSTERPILHIRQPYSNHNGGQVLFGDDGFLYLSTGDGGAGGDPQNFAQNRASLLGKMLRIDVSPGMFTSPPSPAYRIPPDNPFVNVSDVRREIFAYGLRNPWRCAFDGGHPATGEGRGRLFCADVGQSRFEEIDIIEPGGNYGWSAREGNTCFRSDLCGRIGPEVLPIHAYPHSEGKSVTGGHVYRGCANPNWHGDYFFGDYMNGRLYTLSQSAGGAWSSRHLQMCSRQVCFNDLESFYEPRILSFGEDKDGEIYVLTTAEAVTSSPQGVIYRLVDPWRRGDPTTCRSFVPGDDDGSVTASSTAAADQPFVTRRTVAPSPAPMSTVAPMTPSARCALDQFRCSSGECILDHFRCDGRTLCSDGSDEFGCEKPGERRCAASEFRCSSGECVPGYLRCYAYGDGFCADKSDQLGCPGYPQNEEPGRCRPSEFRCRSGECIPTYLRCYGQAFCVDGSDEEGC